MEYGMSKAKTKQRKKKNVPKTELACATLRMNLEPAGREMKKISFHTKTEQGEFAIHIVKNLESFCNIWNCGILKLEYLESP